MEFFLNMHDGIGNHWSVNDSPYAAEGVDWPNTMAALAKRWCPNGPLGSRLEINSHGWPGQIRLNPIVTFAGLPRFAECVKRLVRPGGSIEILSCWVARFNALGLSDALSATGLAKREFAHFAFENDQQAADVAFKEVRTTLPGHKVRYLAQRAANLDREFLFRTSAGAGTKVPAENSGDYKSNANGPLFCARLARQTGCNVRAACIPQAERAEVSGNAQYSTPIGQLGRSRAGFRPGRRHPVCRVQPASPDLPDP